MNKDDNLIIFIDNETLEDQLTVLLTAYTELLLTTQLNYKSIYVIKSFPTIATYKIHNLDDVICLLNVRQIGKIITYSPHVNTFSDVMNIIYGIIDEHVNQNIIIHCITSRDTIYLPDVELLNISIMKIISINRVIIESNVTNNENIKIYNLNNELNPCSNTKKYNFNIWIELINNMRNILFIDMPLDKYEFNNIDNILCTKYNNIKIIIKKPITDIDNHDNYIKMLNNDLLNNWNILRLIILYIHNETNEKMTLEDKNKQLIKLENIACEKNILSENYSINIKFYIRELKYDICSKIIRQTSNIQKYNGVNNINLSTIDDKFKYLIRHMEIPIKDYIVYDRLSENFAVNKDSYEQHIINALDTYNILNILNNDSDNKSFIESCNIFTSNISLTNWYEDIGCGNIMGLLLNLNVSNLSLLWSPINNIEEFTLSLVSLYDYIEIIIKFFDTNKHLTYGNLNNNTIIYGNTIGNGNVIIPLYIHKYHWNIVKYNLNYILGITFGHHPLNYSKSHINSYFVILFEMTHKMFENENILYSDKWIIYYFALLRTCFEIAKMKKYVQGIDKFIDLLVDKKNNITDIKMLFGQIISTCTNVKNKTKITQIIEKYNINVTYDKISDDISNSFYNMYDLIHLLKKEFTSYNKFIKHIDNNFGCVSDNSIKIIKKFIEDKKKNQKIDKII